MSRYQARYTNSFKRQLRKALKTPGNYREEIAVVIDLLIEDMALPVKYNDHPLKGKWFGHRELHIKPDWLLIYRKDNQQLFLTLVATGSHADLFNM